MFATRVPARINPIGLSPVRLLGVEGTTLHVAEIDILDGTPLLDIKPYVPEYDAYIGLRVGWLDDAAIARGPLKADGRFSKEVGGKCRAGQNPAGSRTGSAGPTQQRPARIVARR